MKTVMIALLSTLLMLLVGFSIWLGHSIASKLFTGIVIATGITNEFTALLAVFMGVLLLIFVVMITLLYFGKKVKIFKSFKKILRV